MNSRPRIVRTGLVAAVILTSANLVRAQQAPGSAPFAPIAPIQSRQMPVPVSRSSDIEPGTTASTADTHTLSSIESLGIGSIGALKNYFDPSLRVTQSGGNAATPTWDGISALGMNLDFADHGTHSHLTGYYRGIRTLYFPDSIYNSTYHNLGIAEEYRRARWLFRIREDFLSTPQIGLGGVDLTGVPVSAGTNLANELQPYTEINDTILTARARRVRSATSAEANYSLSRRSTVTVAGSYISSTYSTAGFVDTHRASGRIGYDYLLSPKDLVGIFYEESQMRFNVIAPTLRTDSFQLAYGHRLTGRMAFQIAGGPMRIGFAAANHQLNWTVSNSLLFQSRRAQYSLTYAHSAAGSSGLFTGMTSHSVSASVRYRLSQWWTASDTVGYSFNQNLANVGIAGQIGNWYDTAALERIVGRHMQLSLNYTLQEQTSGSGACATAVCTPVPLRQMIGATMEWHPWAIGPR